MRGGEGLDIHFIISKLFIYMCEMTPAWYTSQHTHAHCSVFLNSHNRLASKCLFIYLSHQDFASYLFHPPIFSHNNNSLTERKLFPFEIVKKKTDKLKWFPIISAFEIYLSVTETIHICMYIQIEYNNINFHKLNQVSEI